MVSKPCFSSRSRPGKHIEGYDSFSFSLNPNPRRQGQRGGRDLPGLLPRRRNRHHTGRSPTVARTEDVQPSHGAASPTYGPGLRGLPHGRSTVARSSAHAGERPRGSVVVLLQPQITSQISLAHARIEKNGGGARKKRRKGGWTRSDASLPHWRR
jgi:hypothetical protein